MCVFNELQSTYGSQLSWFLVWMAQGFSLYRSLKQHYNKPVDTVKEIISQYNVSCSGLLQLLALTF